MKRYTILAPHIDDEVIGCFRLLSKNEVDKVIYFFDLNNKRIIEAEKCAEKFNFKIGYYNGNLDTLINKKDILLVPNIKDNHIDHKIVNSLAKQFPNKKYYYSVDMNTCFYKLRKEEVKSKKEALSIYSSQKNLLQDDKYSLFESFLPDDKITYIYITTKFEGFHRYPDAPEEVSFLRNKHRHLFYCKVKIQVWHDDREIEFILFKREIENLIEDTKMAINNSCEMMANIILDYLVKKYPNRNIQVIVNEDNENGAEINYEIWN